MKKLLGYACVGMLAYGLGSSAALAQTVQIGSLVAGQVSKVYVKVGQNVKKGQSLLNIDSARYQAKNNMLQAQLRLAEARLKDAQVELSQAQDLFDRTVTAKRSLDAAQLAYDVAQATKESAVAELAMHQAWKKYVYVTAPVNAKVVKIHAPVGTTVYKENTPLIELDDGQ
ncbi:efflux RND transporter periplasmic adaptor subunit [Thiomicrorhabdus heinhorstiae]|uniref:Efflux RND transporter periplasmic adaptor subunit n=1 Tax=Thiomicrorhabdus heinhorstiae TaxID=2748010 RepID=A0ABS0BWV6_9GAMM|nr:efflux RND transporter periplasmic adaptor subunit [Thiomicrorhabdus heinhorstiae]MBF6058264.1 efflux RND transporter periplasmic adaptor subunit [Thiomicrorhabdus heinhorstiae]